MRARSLALTTLAVAAALTLTACQDDGTDTAQGAPSTAATAPKSAAAAPSTAAPVAAPPGTAAPAGTTGGARAGAGKAAKCRTADLTITAADATVTGDAERTVAVQLKNHSGKECTIAGYAGVDLQTSAGALSAQRSGEPVVAAVLQAGKSTYFGISYPANTSGGSGVRITGLVVTPPDETHSVTLAWPGAGSLPVTDGSGSQVRIGPMGSAGQGG
ncbi:hypothetical protein Kpho02_44440 [Kitasatospora phosalacinea]|uniref:DUF4232 domain-containing protein n=1 Tax=Kitasatospora phosalacinea TaxID=2065 RepID=A0A9W6Q935_9ACTN|nr:DUF4232 domain-containing protein [Kitasatospora phosalacinea]GLW72145.1 hypothetical protein Kpho02_44440 [Kitasatospora phosalacinea]